MTWAEARALYETRPGTTYQEIAERMGCTHQNVGKKARKEGWTKADRSTLEVAKSLDISKPRQGSALGVRSEENIAQIINTYAVTGNKTLTAGTVGIDRETLARWVAKEPKLAAEMEARRKQFLYEQYVKIANAKDWKAGKEILARAPETKDTWSDNHNTQGPTIILNIQRD